MYNNYTFIVFALGCFDFPLRLIDGQNASDFSVHRLLFVILIINRRRRRCRRLGLHKLV